MPIINAKEPSPGTLKSGFITLLNIFPRIWITNVWLKSSVAIKKGKRVGTIELAHNANAALELDKFDFENISIETIKKHKKAGMMERLTLESKIFL